MLGSLCHPSASVREKAVRAIVECCEIAAATGSNAVKVWLGDGTNYPGQDDLRWRRNRLVEGLRAVHPHLPAGVRMYLEYKLYEPALYSTDVQDWGQSLAVCRAVGEQAFVCVDTGHHAMGVNIEQIVALLLAEGRLASFDLNDKKYGDDDLMVGSIDPYQLFRIAHELVNAMRDDGDPVAQRCASEVVYMLDQCHNIEPKLPAMIRSVMNLQEAVAKALLVDREALLAAQAAGDVLEATACSPTRSPPTSGRSSPSCGRPAACPPTRTAPTSTPARRMSERRPAPAARPPAGAESRPARPCARPTRSDDEHPRAVPRARRGPGLDRRGGHPPGRHRRGRRRRRQHLRLRRLAARRPAPVLRRRADRAPGPCAALAGGLVIVTGSGRRLRDLKADPTANLGVVAIGADGRNGTLLTSPRRLFERLTSEWNSHLAVHDDTVGRTGTNFHAVIHAQPRHLTYLSHLPAYRDEAFCNRRLTRWEAETIINLPTGSASSRSRSRAPPRSWRRTSRAFASTASSCGASTASWPGRIAR